MLTEYKEVRPKKGVNKLFEKCFHVWGIALFRNFFREGAPKFNFLEIHIAYCRGHFSTF